MAKNKSNKKLVSSNSKIVTSNLLNTRGNHQIKLGKHSLNHKTPEDNVEHTDEAISSVTILSVPRSGSSWLGQIFNSSPDTVYRFQPNFAYSFPGKITAESTEKDIEDFKCNLLTTDDPFVLGTTPLAKRKSVPFSKGETSLLVWKEVHALHLAEKLLRAPNTKVIGLVRSPFGVLASWARAPKEFDADWDLASEWQHAQKKNAGSIDKHYGFLAWKTITLDFLRLALQYPERMRICSYRQLIDDPEATVSQLFKYAELEFGEQTRDLLLGSSSETDEDPYSTNKRVTRDDKWKSSLPQEIIDEIKSDPTYQRLQAIFNWQK
jgi:hypothetical protein